jgi:hypothetical protein
MPICRQDSVDYWRNLASDVLSAAAEAADNQSRTTLIALAAVYTDLALRAEMDHPIAVAASQLVMPDAASEQNP